MWKYPGGSQFKRNSSSALQSLGIQCLRSQERNSRYSPRLNIFGDAFLQVTATLIFMPSPNAVLKYSKSIAKQGLNEAKIPINFIVQESYRCFVEPLARLDMGCSKFSGALSGWHILRALVHGGRKCMWWTRTQKEICLKSLLNRILIEYYIILPVPIKVLLSLGFRKNIEILRATSAELNSTPNVLYPEGSRKIEKLFPPTPCNSL